MFIVIVQSNNKTDNTVYYLQNTFQVFGDPICIDKNKLDEIGQKKKKSSPYETSKDELYYPSVIDNNNNLPNYFGL